MRTHLLFKITKQRFIPVVLSLSLIVSLIPSSPVFAEASQLFFTPNVSQMNINTVFDINVRSYSDSDNSNGSVSGTVTFPAHQLQVVSLSVNGSAYGSPLLTQGSGTIGFSGSRSPAPAGSYQIFAIKFKAIGSGTAGIGFTANSKVNNASTLLKTGTFTITNPNPAPSSSAPPKPSSTPKPSPAPIVTSPPTNSPVPSTGPVVTPDPTGLIDTVNISPQYSSAKVSWKVNSASSTSTFTYGFTTSQLDKKATPTKKADGTFEVSVPNLTPGTRYIFYVTATGADGSSGNYTSTIFTRGFPVTLKVTENGKPVTKGQIRIGTTSSQITSNGVATVGLAAGSYTGTITTDTASLAINLTVESKTIPSDGSAPEAQTFTFGLTSSVLEQGPGSGESILTFAIVIVVGSVLLAMAFVGFMAYRRKKFESDSDGFNTYQSPGQSVVIDDGYTWHEPDTTAVVATTPYVPPAEPASIGQPSPAPYHNNSVYINDEEPLDMFDQAAQKLPLPPSQLPTQGDSSVTERSPSSPRSTTP
jgi:hypothetical protein